MTKQLLGVCLAAVVACGGDPTTPPPPPPQPETPGYYFEATDSHGGWVSSTIDLLRFVNGVDGRTSPPDMLSKALVTEMTSNGVTVCPDGACYYAGGSR